MTTTTSEWATLSTQELGEILYTDACTAADEASDEARSAAWMEAAEAFIEAPKYRRKGGKALAAAITREARDVARAYLAEYRETGVR